MFLRPEQPGTYSLFKPHGETESEFFLHSCKILPRQVNTSHEHSNVAQFPLKNSYFWRKPWIFCLIICRLFRSNYEWNSPKNRERNIHQVSWKFMMFLKKFVNAWWPIRRSFSLARRNKLPGFHSSFDHIALRDFFVFVLCSDSNPCEDEIPEAKKNEEGRTRANGIDQKTTNNRVWMYECRTDSAWVFFLLFFSMIPTVLSSSVFLRGVGYFFLIFSSIIFSCEPRDNFPRMDFDRHTTWACQLSIMLSAIRELNELFHQNCQWAVDALKFWSKFFIVNEIWGKINGIFR